MADVKISELTLAAAAGDSVVPASNAAGNATNRVTLQSIANLATPEAIGAAAANHSHEIANITGLQAALDDATTNLTIGTVTTGAAGSNATATLTGTAPDYTLSFGIPAGATGSTGPQGDPGPTTNLTVGTVTTGTAGSNATASVTGTPPNLTLNLTIPRGDTGANGTSGMSLGLFFALS